MSNNPVREAVSYRGCVREKHCSRLEIYDRLRVSEQAEYKLNVPSIQKHNYSFAFSTSDTTSKVYTINVK